MESTPRAWLVVGLILLGTVSRLVPHPWNATPVMAIALFGGTYLSKRWAILLPLAIVAASDALIGWHATVPFTWGAFALTGLLGWWVRRRMSLTRIALAASSGSVLFFLITNAGVWVTGALYPLTLEGLRTCFLAALPFFRNTLLGDAIYTTALFGGFAVARGRLPVWAPMRAR